MTSRFAKQSNFDFFEEKYSRQRGQVARQIEKTVLGHDVGLNGYTTLRQADLLCKSLTLSRNSHFLDIGGGCGWPGLHIAEKSGCKLISTDIPMEALREATVNAKTRGLQSVTDVLAADGRKLPFQPEIFNGIVHADVFC